MNGHITAALIWVANALVTVLLLVVGFAVNQHIKSDKEHRDRTEKEIDKIRVRLHNAENRVAEASTRLRWINEDMEKK